ncbi:MAG: hemolysin family protein, partial [Phascolarctobacterium sp.]
ASDIMVPRTDMICLYLEDPIEENIQTALDERMTRYPICEEDKDHIIGFLHIKDLLRDLNAGQKPDLRALARDVLLVPESLPISKLLKMLQKHRSQLAVLIDEYGGTAGMVTVEDILEEIVGEIQDEFDEERPEVEDKGNKTYSVDGKMLLDDVNDVFELALDTENCDTIGGWLYAQIDYPPKVGQKVKTPEAEFTIEEIAKMRITRVKIQLIHEPENIHEDIQEEYPDDVQ